MLDLIILASAGFTIGAALLGLLALYNALGMASLWLAVGALYLVYLGLMQSRGEAYFDPGGAFGGGGPMLPPRGKQALPAPGPRQIGRSNQALTKHRPALPKRSP
jgi:hypothetical protein